MNSRGFFHDRRGASTGVRPLGALSGPAAVLPQIQSGRT